MYSFSKNSIITQALDFRSVFRKGKRKNHQEFLVLYRDNGLAQSRIGLAIGKKSVALATKRNRIKRIIRESFRHAKNQKNDYIIVARPKISNLSNIELRKLLDSIW